MFRKIHSNRNPQDTILTELRNEFEFYFEKASKILTQILQKKPSLTFAAMITLILLSAGLSFTIFRNKEPAEKKRETVKIDVVNDGFNQILSVGSAIKQTMALKKQIDSLSEKKTLSKQDSEVLVKDLDKLQQLHKPFKP